MDSNETLSSLIGLIYDAALDSSRWPGFLAAYAAAVGAPATALLHHDLRDPRGAITASYQLDPESQRLYAAHFGRIDPWVAGAQAKGVLLPGIVHIGEELISHQDLVRTEYYSDLAKPFGLSRPLSAAIRCDRIAMASVTALRPDSHERFGEPERELTVTLMPHLQRALQIHRRILGLEVMKQAITEALDRLSSAIILVRQDLTILFANGAAEKIVERNDGLTSTRHGLAAAVPNENRQLRLLVLGAAQASAGRGTEAGGALRITRPSLRRPLSVLVAPLPLPRLAPFEDVRGIAALFVTDPEAVLPTNLRTVQTLWGLTRAEALVAIALARGQNLREIGREQSMAVNTVRWHLKHILAKTAARTQAQLVRLLSSGPLF